mgnify:CR=1 FL=1
MNKFIGLMGLLVFFVQQLVLYTPKYWALIWLYMPAKMVGFWTPWINLCMWYHVITYRFLCTWYAYALPFLLQARMDKRELHWTSKELSELHSLRCSCVIIPINFWGSIKSTRCKWPNLCCWPIKWYFPLF